MPNILTTSDLFEIGKGKKFPSINQEDISPSYTALQNYLKQNQRSLLYGIDTGFGPHAFDNNEDRLLNQKSLVYHLTVTPKEDFLSHEEARAVFAARIHSLSLGGSGISYELLELLRSILNQDIIPKIPVRGSLSASGDLIPLSSIALALLGENEWTGQGKHLAPSPSNGKTSKIQGLPRILQPKEALSITNGTSFTTSLLALQTEKTKRLIFKVLDVLKILFEFHPVYSDAFLPALHQTKKFDGPVTVAKFLHPTILKNPKQKQSGKKVQDIYSVRCIPQIIGALFDELISISDLVEKELNSLSDNPVFIPDENRFVEGGNFYASHVSFAADRLQNVIAVLATWIERFIQYLHNPHENDQFTLSLSPEPGKYAGLSGLLIYATHLTAEIRRDSMPGSVQSLSSNGGNQDVVPMGAISIYRNRRCLKDVQELVAILAYNVFQAGSIINRSLDHHIIFQNLQTVKFDRDIRDDIKHIFDYLENQL
ncbi:aromatic amino acid lyase [Leptospira sp. 96542]|nr:aromatic amino acid lyase [Leptospira sp. 96542]